MKKISLIFKALILITLIFAGNAFAADNEYHITASKTSGGPDISSIDVYKDEAADAYFTLKGLAGAISINDVIFHISITKPNANAKATLIATDTNGSEHDVAAMGYWGPTTGFPVSAESDATTKFIGTFDTVGEYKVTVDLKVVSTQAILATKVLTVNVTNKTEITTTNTPHVSAAASESHMPPTDSQSPTPSPSPGIYNTFLPSSNDNNPQTGDRSFWLPVIGLLLAAAGIIAIVYVNKKRNRKHRSIN